MKIVIIGASGHGGICVPKKMCEERNFVAIAPGSKGENVDGMAQTLHKKGYAPAVYSDYREMLHEEKPDVAIVDNFYGEHAPVILDAFEAGCHVLAEKPVLRRHHSMGRNPSACSVGGGQRGDDLF